MAHAVEESQIMTFRFAPEYFDALVKLKPCGFAVQDVDVPFQGGWRELYVAAIEERFSVCPSKLGDIVRAELAKPEGEPRLFHEKEAFGLKVERICEGLYLNVGFPSKYLLDNLRFIYAIVGLKLDEVSITCSGSRQALEAALAPQSDAPTRFPKSPDEVSTSESNAAPAYSAAPVESSFASVPRPVFIAKPVAKPIPTPAPKPVVKQEAPKPKKTLGPQEQDEIAVTIVRDYFPDCVLRGLKERDAFMRLYRERSGSDLNAIQQSRLFKRLAIALTTETPEFPRGMENAPVPEPTPAQSPTQEQTAPQELDGIDIAAAEEPIFDDHDANFDDGNEESIFIDDEPQGPRAPKLGAPCPQVKRMQGRELEITLALLRKFCPKGIDVRFEKEIAQYREALEREFNYKVDVSNEKFAEILASAGVWFDGVVYPVAAQGVQAAIQCVEDAVAKGAKVIFFSELFHRNREKLVAQGIAAPVVLGRILAVAYKTSPTLQKFSFDVEFIEEGTPALDDRAAVKREMTRLLGEMQRKKITTGQLQAAAAYIPQKLIKELF